MQSFYKFIFANEKKEGACQPVKKRERRRRVRRKKGHKKKENKICVDREIDGCIKEREEDSEAAVEKKRRACTKNYEMGTHV